MISCRLDLIHNTFHALLDGYFKESLYYSNCQSHPLLKASFSDHRRYMHDLTRHTCLYQSYNAGNVCSYQFCILDIQKENYLWSDCSSYTHKSILRDISGNRFLVHFAGIIWMTGMVNHLHYSNIISSRYGMPLLMSCKYDSNSSHWLHYFLSISSVNHPPWNDRPNSCVAHLLLSCQWHCTPPKPSANPATHIAYQSQSYHGPTTQD